MDKSRMILMQRKSRWSALLWLLVWVISPSVAYAGGDKPVSLEMILPKTTLHEGESVQLKVLAKLPDASTQHVTASDLTQYGTSDESAAVVSRNGLLQVLSTGGRADMPLDVAASYRGFGIQLRVTLVQKDAVVPPALAQEEVPIGFEIALPKTSLREGETVQLKAMVKFADGSSKDVTLTKTGTRYLTSSLGREVAVDSNGLVTAVSADGWTSRTDTIRVLYRSLKGVIALAVVKKDALYVTAPKTILRVGETVQLTVQQKLPDGSEQDLTDQITGTRYHTSDSFMLIPEPDGKVTCVGTRRKSQESGLIWVKNSNLTGDISFDLLSEGPGPSLEVIAEKTALREGEKTQLRVYKPLLNGGRQEVTLTSTGTAYRIWTSVGKHERIVVKINDKGLVLAPDSIETLTRLSVIVFVRNDDDVGWIELRVLPERGRK